MLYRYQHPFRDGSTQVVLEPLDFIARLAALVPRPRLNLTRFHGLFALKNAAWLLYAQERCSSLISCDLPQRCSRRAFWLALSS